ERLGREDLPGVSELMFQGGPVDEFFSSISGTKIQFAPAGKFVATSEPVRADRISQILGTGADETTIIDAASTSPLHLLTSQVDCVLWSTRGNGDSVTRSQTDQRALSAIRDAGLPVWGVSMESMDFFPLL
ncbi:MAG: hypothetical protein KC800_33790, partial [Candidatus Eremiobacteraeota bacterium]|nr:hypothetical protein [Candidatus Eremiobacteraeota bacterium]